MRRTIIGVIIIAAGILFVVGIIGAIITMPKKLTPVERTKLDLYLAEVDLGILNDLDKAKESTIKIEDFVKKHRNMGDKKFGDGPSVLLDLAEKWKDLEEGQNVKLKNTAEVYLFFIDLYPKHKKAPEVKRWLKVNGYDVD